MRYFSRQNHIMDTGTGCDSNLIMQLPTQLQGQQCAGHFIVDEREKVTNSGESSGTANQAGENHCSNCSYLETKIKDCKTAWRQKCVDDVGTIRAEGEMEMERLSESFEAKLAEKESSNRKLRDKLVAENKNNIELVEELKKERREKEALWAQISTAERLLKENRNFREEAFQFITEILETQSKMPEEVPKMDVECKTSDSLDFIGKRIGEIEQKKHDLEKAITLAKNLISKHLQANIGQMGELSRVEAEDPAQGAEDSDKIIYIDSEEESEMVNKIPPPTTPKRVRLSNVPDFAISTPGSEGSATQDTGMQENQRSETTFTSQVIRRSKTFVPPAEESNLQNAQEDELPVKTHLLDALEAESKNAMKTAGESTPEKTETYNLRKRRCVP